MFHRTLTISAIRPIVRAYIAALLFGVAVLAVGYWTAGQAQAAAPASTANTLTGHKEAGNYAVRSVVDLRALPAAPNVPHSTLPFRRVGPLLTSDKQVSANTLSDVFRTLISPSGYGAPGVITGFNGINSEESGGSGGLCGCVPPDGDMAAGPNHVVVGVNQAFRVFNKSGAPLTAVTGFDTFFNGCGPSGLTSSDPIMVYDPVADRFTVGILRYDGNTMASFVSLAVSQSSDPTTTWNRYCFAQTISGLPALYDFPHISVGQSALYTTGNLYPPGSQVNTSARINAYPKNDMYAGAITVTQVYTDVILNSDNTQADTIRPALFNQGLPTPTNYFINASSAPGSSRITLWRWTDPFGANQFEMAGGVDVATYLAAVPMLQPPPGQPMPPAGYIDTRTLGAMWYNNTLYSTHTIGCNAGGSVTDCVQWYQLGNVSGAPTLIQQGIISGTNESRAYPNVAIDQYGDLEIAYSYSSLSDTIGLRHTGRLASDPLGETGPEGLIKSGEQVEIGYNAARWGDYSGSVLDPDGVTLWHFEEYSQHDTSPFGAWGTWTSASRFPAPSFVGHVTWQGRPAQPSPLQQLPITVTLTSGSTVLNYPSTTTDASGFFTVPLGTIPGGTYTVRVKGPKYLSNSGSFMPSGGPNLKEMGLMRVGDANNDNRVDITDFNILRLTFGKGCGDPGYDDRAEFTGDCRVSASDFNLLRTNFGQAGSQPYPISDR